MGARQALIDEVARREWLYSVDLGGGILTTGRFGPPNRQIMKAFGQVDFRGKRVLDIGCFEGQWSFEAEKRGAAEVLATDYLVDDPRAEPSERGVKELPTFRLAHSVLRSRVQYRPDLSVYNVGRLGRSDFDVVLFCGVYYHLKHPLLALSRLREVMQEGGTLIVEGPAIDGTPEAYARFFYGEVFADDLSNWWVPTLPCLLEWIECSYFEVVRVLDEPRHLMWGVPWQRFQMPLAPPTWWKPRHLALLNVHAGNLVRGVRGIVRREGWPGVLSRVKAKMSRKPEPQAATDGSAEGTTTDGARASGPNTGATRPAAVPKEKIERYTVIARAVSRRDPHYVLPDEDLQRYHHD